MTRRPITDEDLFHLAWVDEPRLSATGRQLAFTVTHLDREADAMVSNVSWVELDDEGRAASTPRGSHRGRRPAWSPAGSQLMFVAEREDGEALCVCDERDRARAVCASAPSISEWCWSPDGQRAAYASGRQLSLVSLGDGAAHKLFRVDEDDLIGSLQWSPDGKFIACVVQGAGAPSAAVWLISLAGDSPRCALRNDGPIRALAWSPRGDALAFIGHDKGFAQGVNFSIFVAPIAGDARRNLTALLDRSVGSVVRGDDARGTGAPDLRWVSARGEDRIYFAYADGGQSRIAWAGLDGRVNDVVVGARACLSFDIAPSANALAYVASDTLNPGEIFCAGLDGDRERAATQFNSQWLSAVALSDAEPMALRASDGACVEAWLMRPQVRANTKSTPLIVQIHGGPHYSVGHRFYFELQRLAAQGYAVAFGNPRGSQAYGEAFATRIRADWGGRDFADVMELTDAASRQPGVDPARMVVTGVSYGGYMTHWAIAHTHRFRAAISENGISNLASNFAATTGQAFWAWQMDGTPATQPDRFRALSPLTHADAIRTPLLLVHAEQDTTCSIGQSEEMQAALRARGVEADLVRIPGEGHLMNLVGKPSSRMLRAGAIDAWLRRWLAN